MATVYKAPEATPEHNLVSIFLAGSIDQGAAEDWQALVTEGLLDFDLDIYNPRRDDWDWTWEQSIHNPKFKQQVTWELDHLERADVVCLYFDKNGKAPISLLEFGLFHKKMIVCCPEGFWRKGNVDIVCERYHIPLVDNINDLVKKLRTRIAMVGLTRIDEELGLYD